MPYTLTRSYIEEEAFKFAITKTCKKHEAIMTCNIDWKINCHGTGASLLIYGECVHGCRRALGNVMLKMSNQKWLVLLRRGKLSDEAWWHNDKHDAMTRAYALASLHSTLVNKDENRMQITVDASEFYNKRGY